MMRKRWTKAGLILIAILVLLSGCSKDQAETAADKKEETTAAKEEKAGAQAETETKTESGKKDGQEEETKQGSGNAAAPEQKSTETFYVYYSNADADELVKEMVETDEISPEIVLKALADKGVLPENVKINSLKEGEQDGEKVLDVDFSREFAEYAGSMGSTGEYMIMGGVCNTFLDAYGCKKIHISVEGGVFTTGHNEYPGYLGFHE